MSLESVTEAMRANAGEDSGLGVTVKFNFGEDGVIHLDAASVPNAVTNEDKDADCTIGITLADFEELMAGNLDATSAFMAGKLKVDGDMSIAMKLSQILG